MQKFLPHEKTFSNFEILKQTLLNTDHFRLKILEAYFFIYFFLRLEIIKVETPTTEY